MSEAVAKERTPPRPLLVRYDVVGEMAEPEPEYLVAKEVAKLLRLSEKSIYRIMKDDPSFPRVKLAAGSYRFPRARVQRWIAKKTHGGK